MTYWLIKIKGAREDLSLLERLLFAKNVSLVRESDLHYLQIQNPSNQIDLAQIKERAEQAINIVNGTARLYHNRFQEISLDIHAYLVSDDGTRQAFGFLTAKATDNILTAFSSHLDTTLSDWVDKAFQDEVIQKVLSLYGSLKLDWRGLYLVLDAIMDDLGGETELKNKGWVSKNKIELFKSTANSYSGTSCSK